MAKKLNKFKIKNPHQLQRLVRGFSNHRRIEILNLLDKNPELTVADISEELKINFKTASVHTQRLAIAGLIMKRYRGASVHHKLTSRGVRILKFLRILE